MSLDNDTDTNMPPPSAGIPSADSPAVSSPPDAAPQEETPEQRKKRLAADRQARLRDRKAGRAAGFAIPKRATSSAHVHRTNPEAGRNFHRFNGGASYATSTEARRASSPPNPLAAVKPVEASATVEVSKVTDEEAAMYGKAVAFYAKMGIVALAQRQKITAAQRKRLTDEALPFIEALVGGCTASVVKRHNIRVPYVEEGVVGVAVGVSTWALLWGQGDNALSNALAIGEALMNDKELPEAPTRVDVAAARNTPAADAGEAKPADGASAAGEEAAWK